MNDWIKKAIDEIFQEEFCGNITIGGFKGSVATLKIEQTVKPGDEFLVVRKKAVKS